MNAEKVIKGLECCEQGHCDGCPYAEECFSVTYTDPYVSPVAHDAIKLIRELLNRKEE